MDEATREQVIAKAPMSDALKVGALLIVTLANVTDARPMRAVYLGAVEGAMDRPGRRMYAVDDGNAVNGWALMMETQIATSRPVNPPFSLLVVKDPDASSADLEALADLISEANRDPSGFIVLPADVMAQVQLVTVQDVPDAPDAVEVLRKILAQEGPTLIAERDRLTPEEVALCERLRQR
jgi:hypothetical protein